ncbi:MAG: hypothetical protein IPN76_00990 [Saprospiraceae bacterium]|nr:hypothetical protein [Saprospiraceae bacterium]
MNKQDLIQLLTDNEMDSLFEQLKSRQRNSGEQVLLESQWKDLQSRQRSGTISYDQANLEAARLRKGLLELIDMSFSVPSSPAISSENNPPFTSKAIRSGMLAASIAGAALLVYLLVFQLLPLLNPADAGVDKQSDPSKSTTTLAATGGKPGKARSLNISAAEPLTFSPGDEQYERVYSVIKGKVESIGGGRCLVTLKIGLDFKGIINTILSNDKFRLVADELRGPLAPTNFLSVLIDSKSYGEGEIKFELSDAITDFSLILEGKEDRKWDFNIE